jgi:hypothetical protein
LKDLPLFPLNTVLFPGGRLALRIFEQRYMEMAKACIRDGSPFGVCLIREGKEVGAPATPVAVGCLARIGHWDMPQLGLLHITALGAQRFRILQRRVEAHGLARASIELLENDSDSAIPEDCAGCVRLLEAPHRLDSASWVSSRLAELLPLPLAAKQELLELADGRVRLERLNSLLAH